MSSCMYPHPTRKSFLTLSFLLIGFTIVGQKTVDIQYIANEGFLISAGNEKVLVDGIFNNAYAKYHVPTSLALTQERGALSPFDSITVLLCSHKHADHINADFVAEHMVNDTKSVLICPSQVNDLLKPLSSYTSIKDRIVNMTPAFAMRVDTIIKNIKIQVMSFRHPNDPKLEIQDIGFIININGFKIFHSGDAVNDNLGFFQNLNLDQDSIDIAFMSRWYFDTEYGNKGTEIMKYLHPKAIIAMHINTDKYTYYKNAANSIQGIAPVYFMETPMVKMNFVKDSISSVVTATDNIKRQENRNSMLRIYSTEIVGQYMLAFGPTSVQVAKIEIFAVSGQLVYSKVLTNIRNTIIDLTNKPQSVYFLRAQVDGVFYNQKIVI